MTRQRSGQRRSVGDGRLRAAGVAVLVALALGAVGRALFAVASGLVFGPLLGGVTPLVVIALPATADAVVLPLILLETAIAVAVAVWAGTTAVRLVRRLPVDARRRRSVTETLLVLGAVYSISALAVLPWSGLEPGVADVVGICVWSALDLAPVGYAAWAVRQSR